MLALLAPVSGKSKQRRDPEQRSHDTDENGYKVMHQRETFGGKRPSNQHAAAIPTRAKVCDQRRDAIASPMNNSLHRQQPGNHGPRTAITSST